MEFNGTFLATIITFILFVFVMNKVLYAPLLGIMEERKKFIDSNYKDANENDAKSAELVYEKEGLLPQANAYVKNIMSAGFFKDVNDYDNDPHSTFRYRWLANVSNAKPLWGWDKYLMLGYLYQHAAALYQTGDFVGAVRVGPRLYSDLGRLYLEVDYLVGGQYGESPFYFDRYRYGKNNIIFRAQWYVNKYLSLAYFGSSNVIERNIEGDWLTENQFIVAVGTDDIKLRIGFDTIRESTTVGLDLLLGSNKTLIEFDDMTIENVDAASSGKEKKEKRKKLKKQKQLEKQRKKENKNL